jgi:type VI secretion system protein ImpK
MTPEFARPVDRIFLNVLQRLERIDLGEDLSPEEERENINRWLETAESELGNTDAWQLAKYALVAWIDESLINASWAHRDWWVGNTLEWEHFSSMDRAEMFFKVAKLARGDSLKAQETEALPVRLRNIAHDRRRPDALEVFYVCVVLGFRGLYALEPAEAAVLADMNGLPADLETWARNTSVSIQLGRGLPPIDTTGAVSIETAVPLRGAFRLLWALLGAFVLSVAGLIVALLFRPWQ